MGPDVNLLQRLAPGFGLFAWQACASAACSGWVGSDCNSGSGHVRHSLNSQYPP